MSQQAFIGLGFAVFLLSQAVNAVAAPSRAALEEARKLSERVQLLYAQGNHQEALPLASQVVQIRERELGQRNADTAAAVHQLALLKDSLGAYEEAEALYLRTIVQREQVLGPEHPDVANSLSKLGSLYVITGEFAKAEVHHQRALAIALKSLGAEHLETAKVMNNYGNFFYMTEAFDKAEEMYKRSLGIREKTLGPEHAETALSLSNLANVYSSTSDYNQSLSLYRRALSIREKTHPEHPLTANIIGNMGNMYRIVGDYPEAERLNKRTIELRQKLLGPEHPLTANALTNLAYVYQSTGAYAQAEPLFQRSLAIYEKQFGAEHPETAKVIGSLAVLYHLMQEFSHAEPLYHQARSIYEEALGVDSPSVAMQLTNLAEFYVDTGAYAKAEPAYLRALDIRQRILGTEHPETAALLYSLAALYANTGSTDKATELHQRALEIREKTRSHAHPEIVESLNALASLHWRSGATAKALQLFSGAQTLQAKNSEKFLVSTSDLRRRAYLQAHNDDVFKAVSFSVAVPTREGIALGLTSILQHKGRTLDESSNSVTRLRTNLSTKDQVILEQLTDVATRLSNLTYQGSSLSPTEYKQRLNSLLQRHEGLEMELSNLSNEFRKQTRPINVASVRQAIPDDAALVEWFRYTPFDPTSTGLRASAKPRYVAYVLKRGADTVVIDMGDAHSIETLIQHFRLAVSNSKSTNANATAAALSDKILKPLRAHIKGTAHLLISPDGALNLLPMAAMLDERGTFMAQRFDITYVASGRDLLQIGSVPTKSTSAVIMADPRFGTGAVVAQLSQNSQSERSADLDRGGLIFRPLANTALEAQDLKKLLKLDGSSILLHEDATESNIKRLHSPRILHIASHGFFLNDQEMTAERQKRSALTQLPSGENPLLRSGIALAGANARRSGTNDDGILTALEVAQLDLHGTELVVLSACDSGVGDVQNGEGVYGLRRALVLAGAQTQVTSLWKVSDEATRMLMVDYYQRLLKGEGRSAALRHAQQAMLSKRELSHPYYWASFVPTGNWAPMPTMH